MNPNTASPDICVLLPFRNAAAHLGEALDSLRAQTYPGWSALLLDDGSTDASAEIAARAAASDPRFELVKLPPRGLVETLNAGLGLCRAPLVARIDADDIALPRRFELQRDFLLSHPRVDIVGGLVHMHDDPPPGEGMLRYVEWSNALRGHAAIRREIFVESPLVHPSVVIRADALRDAAGWRDPGWPEDYDLWFRLMRAGRRFAKVPEPVLLWRDTPGRLSRADEAYNQTNFRRCKLHHLMQSVMRRHPEITLWGAGREGRWWCRELTVNGVRVRRFIDIDPRKIGRSVGDIPVVPPEALSVRDPDDFILAAVGSIGARPLIRAALLKMKYREEHDFLFLA